MIEKVKLQVLWNIKPSEEPNCFLKNVTERSGENNCKTDEMILHGRLTTQVLIISMYIQFITFSSWFYPALKNRPNRVTNILVAVTHHNTTVSMTHGNVRENMEPLDTLPSQS